MIKMPDQENVDNSDSALVGKGCKFPEGIAEWVLEEPGNVLERTPSLSHISWLLSLIDKLHEVAVSLLGECSRNHLSSLVHVWVAVHEALDTGQSLPEVRLGVLSIVEVLRHFC